MDFMAQFTTINLKDMAQYYKSSEWDLRNLTRSIGTGQGSFNVFAPLQDGCGEFNIEVAVRITTLEWRRHLWDFLLHTTAEPARTTEELYEAVEAADGFLPVKMLSGFETTFEIDDEGEITIDGARMLKPYDVKGVDGYIHLVEQVPLPPSVKYTIYDQTQQNSDMSTVTRLIDTVQLGVFMDNLLPLTFFSAVDSAWDIAIPTLEIEDVLKNMMFELLWFDDTLADMDGETLVSTNKKEWLIQVVEDPEAEPLLYAPERTPVRIYFSNVDGPEGLTNCTFIPGPNRTNILARTGVIHHIDCLFLDYNYSKVDPNQPTFAPLTSAPSGVSGDEFFTFTSPPAIQGGDADAPNPMNGFDIDLISIDIAGSVIDAELAQIGCPDVWQGLIDCVVQTCPNFMDACPNFEASSVTMDEVPSCEALDTFFCESFSSPSGDCCLLDCLNEFYSLAACTFLEATGEDRSDCMIPGCPASIPTPDPTATIPNSNATAAEESSNTTSPSSAEEASNTTSPSSLNSTAPTTNELVQVNATFDIFNTEGLTAEMLLLPENREILEEAFIAFVVYLFDAVETGNKDPDEVQRLLRSLLQRKDRKLSVRLQSERTKVYDIQDVPCRSDSTAGASIPDGATCQDVYGKYELVVEGEDADEAANTYVQATEDAFQEGKLQEVLAEGAQDTPLSALSVASLVDVKPLVVAIEPEEVTTDGDAAAGPESNETQNGASNETQNSGESDETQDGGEETDRDSDENDSGEEKDEGMEWWKILLIVLGSLFGLIGVCCLGAAVFAYPRKPPPPPHTDESPDASSSLLQQQQQQRQGENGVEEAAPVRASDDVGMETPETNPDEDEWESQEMENVLPTSNSQVNSNDDKWDESEDDWENEDVDEKGGVNASTVVVEEIEWGNQKNP